MTNIVNHYKNLWNLDDLKSWKRTKSSETFIGFKKKEEVLLKVLTATGLKDEARGVAFLNHYQGRGAVGILEFSPKAILMKLLKGSDLYRFSKAEAEESTFPIFSKIISQIQEHKTLNSLPHIKSLLPGLKESLDSLSKYEDSQAYAFLKKGFELFETLLESEKKVVNLHGDLHHENIIIQEGVPYFIDPKGFRGDPCYELGTILKNPWDFPNISQSEDHYLIRSEKLAASLELCLERVRHYAFVHVALSYSWALEDREAGSHQLTLLRLMDKHVS